MPWVRFFEPFDFKPKKAITIAYPAGFSGLVTQQCATAVTSAGTGELIERPADGGRRTARHSRVGIPDGGE